MSYLLCCRWFSVWLEYRYNNLAGSTDLGLSRLHNDMSVDIAENSTYGRLYLRINLISFRQCSRMIHYTPGIYAEGYIVFVFPFVRSYVRMFVRSFVRLFVLPSVTWNLRQSFALKFLKWCISQQLLIRKHSYLDHSYPGGLAFTP